MAVPTKSEIKEFQKKLKQERSALSISQTQLAKNIGVTQAHLSYIESGHRSLTPERYRHILREFDKRRRQNGEQ